MSVFINSAGLSALFSKVDSIQNPEVKHHLLRAQNCFENAEKFNDPAWISHALFDIRQALFDVSSYLYEESVKEIRKNRKLAHNAHKRTMRHMSNAFSKGRSVDYTPKKGADPWDDEPIFGQQPPKQEVDEEDTIVSFMSQSKYPTWMDYEEYKRVTGRSHCQSKSKAKWQRSGRAARVLSNR